MLIGLLISMSGEKVSYVQDFYEIGVTLMYTYSDLSLERPKTSDHVSTKMAEVAELIY